MREQARGQKNGRGYYTYDPDTRASTPDPEVVELIKNFAVGKGIEQPRGHRPGGAGAPPVPDGQRGSEKILDEGIAVRGSDIDVVWVNGYGWPVYRGGPMYWADQVGLAEIVGKIKHYSDTLGGNHWNLSPLLERLAAEGGALHQFSN